MFRCAKILLVVLRCEQNLGQYGVSDTFDLKAFVAHVVMMYDLCLTLESFVAEISSRFDY